MNADEWGDALSDIAAWIPSAGLLVLVSAVFIRIVMALFSRNRTEALRKIARPITSAMAVQSTLLGVPPQTQENVIPVDHRQGEHGILDGHDAISEGTERNQPSP